MNLVVKDNETNESYVTIADASAAQIAAYTSADVIKASGHELVVEEVLVESCDEVTILVR